MLVFLGGAAGSMWRFWWSGLVAQRFGETFPFGTLVVNMVGSTIDWHRCWSSRACFEQRYRDRTSAIAGCRDLRGVDHVLVV